MIPAAVFLLASAACSVLFVAPRPWPTAPGTASADRPARRRRRLRVTPDADLAMIRIVRQLAALLTAGRSGPALWADLAETLAAETGGEPGPLVGRPAMPLFSEPPGRTLQAPRTGPTPGHVQRTPTVQVPTAGSSHLKVILAAHQASSLGLPASAALRAACGGRSSPSDRDRNHGPSPGDAPGPGPAGAVRGLRGRGAGARDVLSTAQQDSWRDVAACFEVCEASGAPLAAVLQRLAARLEAEQDAAALRATALAGPRATVRLLSWLPFIGLLLGTAMGVDPFAVLLGDPLGWGCLLAGIALTGLGRWWSNRLILAAAGPVQNDARTLRKTAGARKSL